MAVNNALNLVGTLGQVATVQANGTIGMQDLPAASQSSPARALNTIYQAPANSRVLAFYTVNISCVLSLSGGQAGTCVLEACATNTFLSGVITPSSPTFSNTGTLVIGVTLTQINSAQLAGLIPAGFFYRIRTINVNGTPTFTYITGQEVLI